MQVAIEVLPTAGQPWEGYLIPTAFPIIEPHLTPLKTLLGHIVQSCRQSDLQRDVFLHSWKLHEGATGRLLHDHLQAWSPRLGMGVWPDREPPQPLTQERFMDMSAGGLQREELSLPAYRLLHLEGETDATTSAISMVFGGAALTLIFSQEGFAELRAAGKAIFLPTITAPIYTHERFYMPLLDRRSMASARSVQQLATWLCKAELYLRESAEDAGILLVSRRPLKRLLDEAALAADIQFVWPGTEGQTSII